jgi:HD-GYP domain-containing protein (c-di-GMP phosphodiesterase class II)
VVPSTIVVRGWRPPKCVTHLGAATQVRSSTGRYERVIAPQVSRTRPGLFLWWAALVGFGGLLVAGLRGPLAAAQYVSPVALFWLVVIGAGLCWLPAVAVIVIGWRRGLAELAILGAALAVESGFGEVHGLTVPGVLYGPNNAVLSSAFLALPIALVTAIPILVRRSNFGAVLGRHWRGWAVGWTGMGVAGCAVLLLRPDTLAAPTMDTPFPVAVGACAFIVTVVLSVRHLRLYWVGRLRASLATSLTFLFLGLSGLVWLGRGPFSLGFWAAHILDIGGVAGAAVSLAIGYRSHRPIAQLMAPVLTRDPLVALDLGLSPVAHRFVALLDRKDPISRDHVVRVGELAVRTGERAGMRGTRLRNLGLAGLFHDVGKLEVPESILKKPGSLTEDEMAVIRTHPAIGERLMQSETELAPAASFVRSHHERQDGRGYPDGSAGDQIPIEVAIISTCDAFDAMCHTRQYREGMGRERAFAVLREHAGSQWSAEVVDLVIATIESDSVTGQALDHVGRDLPVEELACGCIDALPDPVRELALANRDQS